MSRWRLAWRLAWRDLSPRLRGLRLLALCLFLGVATLAPAAAFKATLLVPAGDERLDRTRVERAYFGHPTGPASDGVQVALKEARLELESAGASLAVETVEVGSAAEARAAHHARRRAKFLEGLQRVGGPQCRRPGITIRQTGKQAGHRIALEHVHQDATLE